MASYNTIIFFMPTSMITNLVHDPRNATRNVILVVSEKDSRCKGDFHEMKMEIMIPVMALISKRRHLLNVKLQKEMRVFFGVAMKLDERGCEHRV